MYPQIREALAPTRSRATVLRQKTAHKRSYGRNSETYMSMVHKWRFHYYGIIHKVFENAGEFDFPIVFAPLEKYLDGFTVEYHDIGDLPSDLLSDLRHEDEVEEGWNFIHEGTIHIFYDANVHPKRQRFTIAHEWGHVFQKLDWEFKQDMEAIPNVHEQKRIIESVANHFAAYYLVPFPLFRCEYQEAMNARGNGGLHARLAERFEVSEEVINHYMLNFRKRLIKQ